MFCRTNLRATVIAAGTAVTLSSMATLLAQNKATVWTKVSVAGNVVALAWDQDHPWDRDLSAGIVQLVARYRGNGGRDVVEAIAKGTPRGAHARATNFALPEDIKGTPQSPVCLFFQLADRRVLPVRQSTQQNGDTAGFRYEPWERRVRERAALRDATARVSTAERALAAAAGHVQRQESIVTTRGWTGPAACGALGASRASSEVKPYGAVPPEQHDDIARRVCVRRVSQAQDYADRVIEKYLKPALQEHDAPRARRVFEAIYSFAFMLPDVAGPLLHELKQAGGPQLAGLATRETQAAAFMRDWARFQASSKDYQPHFGRDDDKLGWVGSASAVAYRVHAPGLAPALGGAWLFANQAPATTDDVRSLVGIALDAYEGCVADGKAQLKIQYDSWEALQASAPQRAAAVASFAVKECRQGLDLLDKLKAELILMETQLAREQAALRTAQEAASSPLPTSTQTLNSVSCGTQ